MVNNLRQNYELADFEAMCETKSGKDAVSDQIVFIQNYFSSDETRMTFRLFDTRESQGIKVSEVSQPIKNYYFVKNGIIYPGTYYRLLNEHEIPVYTVDGKPHICIEDLKFCRYTMVWDANARVTHFTKNGKNEECGLFHILKNQGQIYLSDVQIEVEDHMLRAYNINGYSLVAVEDLEALLEHQVE